MALITCTECGREISDKAASCPRCGCPIEFIHPIFSNISNDKLTDGKQVYDVITTREEFTQALPIGSQNNYSTSNTNININCPYCNDEVTIPSGIQKYKNLFGTCRRCKSKFNFIVSDMSVNTCKLDNITSNTKPKMLSSIISESNIATAIKLGVKTSDAEPQRLNSNNTIKQTSKSKYWLKVVIALSCLLAILIIRDFTSLGKRFRIEDTIAKELKLIGEPVVKIRDIRSVENYSNCYDVTTEVTHSSSNTNGVPTKQYVVKLDKNKIIQAESFYGMLESRIAEKVCR